MRMISRTGQLLAAFLFVAPAAVRAAGGAEPEPLVAADITVDNGGSWTGDLAKYFSAEKASSDEAASLRKAYPGHWDWIEAGDLLGDGVRTVLLISGERSRKTEDGFVVFEMRLVRRKGKGWRELARLSRAKGLVAAGTAGTGKPAGRARGYELTLRVLRSGDGPSRMGIMAAPIGPDGLPREDSVEIDWSPSARKYVRFLKP